MGLPAHLHVRESIFVFFLGVMLYDPGINRRRRTVLVFNRRCGYTPDSDVPIVIDAIEIFLVYDDSPAVVPIFIYIDIYVGYTHVPDNYRAVAPAAVAVIGLVRG